jgi:hypothetical protein
VAGLPAASLAEVIEREQTIKARLAHPVADWTHLNPQAQAFLADQLREAYGQPAPQLATKVTIAYRRTTLVDLRRGMRFTFDVDLRWYCVAVALLHPGIRRNPWHRTLQRYFADATQSAPSREPNPGALGLLRGRDAGI